MPGSYGCLVFNKLYPTDTETAIPSHEETVRILEEIRIYGQNTHKQTSDHEHINKLMNPQIIVLQNQPIYYARIFLRVRIVVYVNMTAKGY